MRSSRPPGWVKKPPFPRPHCLSLPGTEKVSGTDPKAGDQFGRLWTFQTCNEFGWYQTCESGSNCPYTQGFNTIHWALDICNLLFDMSPGDVLHNIDKTNQFYGGAAYPGATYTVFPNGEVGIPQLTPQLTPQNQPEFGWNCWVFLTSLASWVVKMGRNQTNTAYMIVNSWMYIINVYKIIISS